MKFNVNQNDLQKSLGYCQGVIEKRSTLPVLSNILLDASGSRLKIIATDVDLLMKLKMWRFLKMERQQPYHLLCTI